MKPWKRMGVCLLSCLLLLSPALAQTAANHIMWDIPWGIPMEEFMKQAKENAGIVFVEDEMYGENSIACVTARLDSPVEVLGYPVEMIRAWALTDTSGYDLWYTAFDMSHAVKFRTDAYAMFADLAQRMSQQYQKPAKCYMWLSSDAYVGVPWKDGQVDAEAVQRILEQEGDQSLHLSVKIDNVELEYADFTGEADGEVYQDLNMSLLREVQTEESAFPVYESYEEYVAAK